ncbi:imidazolonepropionase [Deltaproteobacteria bacterium Smac51]|nr:imidazolonepropionase [Deltaproteobacteria bacterium Smac51]
MSKHTSGERTIWVNGLIATMNPEIDDQYGLLRDQAIVTEGHRIVEIVPQEDLKIAAGQPVVDFGGALVTPGLIDCHTHLIFGGDRAAEWEMRLNGASYTEIAAKGGGISSTVAATREADFETLYNRTIQRLAALVGDGVTTVEIKSGYGLDLENERKTLEVAAALQEEVAVDISPTLLSAHSVPKEFAGRPDDYIDEICNNIMPALYEEGLFEAVDIFIENIAFNLEQTEKLFKAATALNIPVKAHSEQLSNIGGSGMVAKFDGLSTDHIERLDEDSIKLLSEKRTVAVLLPLAFYFLKDTIIPPVELLRKYKVPMAVSTDFNPGTSPFASPRLAMNMACTLFGLTPAEALAGMTRNAARALGRESIQGQLKAGYQANFAIWDVERPVEIFYEIGRNPLVGRVFLGASDF